VIIRISEANGSPKRQKLRTQINGKFTIKVLLMKINKKYHCRAIGR
jgi:hypothetical protein